jgi:hypothetical protein
VIIGSMWLLTLLRSHKDVLICIFVPFLTQCVLKLWWPWTYQNSTVKCVSTRVVLGWVTSWEAMFRGAKKQTILCRIVWVVTNGIRVIAQPEMEGVCTSPWGSLEGIRWDAKNGVVPWESPARTSGPKRDWLWRSTSPQYGNGDVLICIFSPFLTQRVLKLWWPWTYQNSLDKLAYVRVVPGWVTI